MKEASITMRDAGATGRARALRRDQTDAEYRLWFELKDRQLGGFKFVRQVPLGSYVADFLCRSERLVVELDGEPHADSATDAPRTAWLNAHGYSIPRFWNHEVLRERGSVLDTILAILERRVRGADTGLRFAPASPSPGRFAATLSPPGRGEVPSRTAEAHVSVPEAATRSHSSPPWGEVASARSDEVGEGPRGRAARPKTP
jgi:very-short-patch-repair endonuclease